MVVEANIFNFIKYLEKQEGYVTSDSLSRLFHLSPKTVLNRIDQYNELLKSYDIYISKLPRKGIKLELNNEENINTFFEDNYVYFMTPDQRRDYIIMKLLMSSCPISNDEFQDELFVSYSTLQNDLVYVRDLLKKNNLYLSNIRKKGYEIKGEEKNIRQYFSQFVSKKTEIMSFFSIDSEIRIKKDLFYIINHHEFDISDNAFNDLFKYIVIAIKRIKHISHSDIETYRSDLGNNEEFPEKVKNVSKDIAKLIEKETGKFINSNEVKIIMIKLATSQSVDNEDDIVFINKVRKIVDKIVYLINISFRFNFEHDSQLKRNLLFHISPLIYRLKYNLQIENPLKYEIIKKYPAGYILARVGSKVLEKEFMKDMTQDEIAFLALHFAVAIEKELNKDALLLDILIVCGSGRGSAKLIEYKIKDVFGQLINRIDSIELYGLKDIDEENYDLILTTLKIDSDTKIPILKINSLLNSIDLNELSIVFNQIFKEKQGNMTFSKDLYLNNISAKSRNDALYKLISLVSDQISIDDDAFQQIILRENIITTEIGNLIAIPHSLEPITKKTTIAVGILDSPIKWHEQNVQLIFLFLMGEDNLPISKDVYDVINLCMNNKVIVKDIIKTRTYEEFLNIINNNIGDGLDNE
ncbi:hypothetical protein DBT40_06430 [Aerococcus tenax]|nr:hypothetical protein DBT40_06430 [Aerococcus urinae]